MANDDLIRLGAAEAVALLRRRAVSPVELVEAAARRIEAVDGEVNALPTRFFDVARDDARRFVDASHGPAAEHPGWLAGLPIAVKDYNDVAGQRTTFGSPIFADNVAAESDLTVRTLVASGAIPIAKSNVPEFAGSNTFNPVFGATRNPWDLRKSAGGSSGGSAAALATGEVWLATGNDLGGSLRIPASFCGTVGLRPSPGRVPRGAALPPFDVLWVEGPMARNVADLALMLDAGALPSPHDPLSLPPPALSFQDAVRQARPPRRVAFTPDLGLAAVDPEVAEICRAGAARFAAMGTVVEETGPDFAGGIDAFQVLRALLFAAVRGDLLATDRHRIAPEIVWNIEKGFQLTVAQIVEAERARHRIFQAVATFFDDWDLLACPTVAVPPFPVEQRYPTEIGGVALTSYIDWMFLTFVLTLTGCPAISIPCGVTAAGLPVGLQIVGRSQGESSLLAAAHLLEQELGLAGRVPIDPRTGTA